jgi:hypothetical protein
MTMQRNPLGSPKDWMPQKLDHGGGSLTCPDEQKPVIDPFIKSMADQITALQSENERLREACVAAKDAIEGELHDWRNDFPNCPMCSAHGKLCAALQQEPPK